MVHAYTIQPPAGQHHQQLTMFDVLNLLSSCSAYLLMTDCSVLTVCRKCGLGRLIKLALPAVAASRTAWQVGRQQVVSPLAAPPQDNKQYGGAGLDRARTLPTGQYTVVFPTTPIPRWIKNICSLTVFFFLLLIGICKTMHNAIEEFKHLPISISKNFVKFYK